MKKKQFEYIAEYNNPFQKFAHESKPSKDTASTNMK